MDKNQGNYELPELLVGSVQALDDYVAQLLKSGTYGEYAIEHMTPLEDDWTIEEFRNIRQGAYMSSPTPRLVVLHNMQRASELAQNTLLKLLEEPPSSVRLLLHTTNERSLLPTILSRVRRVADIDVQEMAIDDALTASANEWLLGGCLLHETFATVKNRDELQEKLRALLTVLHGNLAQDPSVALLAKYILRLMADADTFSLNPQMCMDSIAFTLKKFTT